MVNKKHTKEETPTKKNNESEWPIKGERYVAFLDILGFKDLVGRQTHDEIYQKLNKISVTNRILQNLHNEEDENLKNFTKNGRIKVVTFSDSIIIFSEKADEDNLNYFIFSVSFIIAKSFDLGIPMKGSVAFGEVSLNFRNQIFFGQAIIDAYILQEEVHYFGIVVHNSFENMANNTVLKGNHYIEKKTPLKGGMIIHKNFNWFMHLKTDNIPNKKENIIKKIESFRLTTSGNTRKYIDNTLEFISDLNFENKK
jgi:hypothetical protein